MYKAALALGLLLTGAPALAQDYLAFTSPSGNIACAIMLGDGAALRCDLRDYTPSFTEPPKDCDHDWGMAFVLGATGPGRLGCVSDAVGDPGAMVVEYGARIAVGPFLCRSETSGLTCTNPEGHGFALSRAQQRVF